MGCYWCSWLCEPTPASKHGESNVFTFSWYFKYGGSKFMFVLLVTVTNASGSSFKPSNVLVILTKRFSWLRAVLCCRRTGLKLGSGSEPALELLWWKRGHYRRSFIEELNGESLQKHQSQRLPRVWSSPSKNNHIQAARQRMLVLKGSWVKDKL